MKSSRRSQAEIASGCGFIHPTDKLLLKSLSLVETDCVHRAAVVIEPVSADSLLETGIFAGKAGDFRRFPPQDRSIGSPETKSNTRKAGISGPIARRLRSLGNRRTGWLPWEGSNSDIPIRIPTFEIFREFPLIVPTFGL